MPRILWMSPYSLHDFASGTAVNCKTMLEALKNIGFEVCACSCTIFETQHGSSAFSYAKSEDEFEIQENGIKYFYLKTPSTNIEDMSLLQMHKFANMLNVVLDKFKPDLAITYGTNTLCLESLALAKRRSITTAYAAFNYKATSFLQQHLRPFYVDLLLTNTQDAAKYYQTHFNLYAHNIGEFFDLKKVIADKKEPQSITLINPGLNQGLAIFCKLITMLKKDFPQEQFCVVDTQNEFAHNIKSLYIEENGKKRTAFSSNEFKDVNVIKGTSDLSQVYASSKLLICPNLNQSFYSREVTEAILNKVPVLACKSQLFPTALLEASASSAVQVDMIASTIHDEALVPSDEECNTLYTTAKHMIEQHTQLSEKLEAAKEHLIKINAFNLQRLLFVIKPFIMQRVIDNKYYNQELLYKD